MKYIKTFDDTLQWKDKKFQDIVNFYLFECPVENVSQRGKSFKKYGVVGKVKFSELKKQMLNCASKGLKNNYYPCKKEELLKKYELVKSIGPVEEYCVFMKYDEKTVMQSLYSAIRNAIAHGSFSCRSYAINGEKINMYFFLNYNKYKKAEIVLREKTLLSWIELLRKEERK